MSHIVTIETQVRDAEAVRAACRRLGLASPVHRKVALYSGEAVGLSVELPDWRYPVVIDTQAGTVRYDNFDEHWGRQEQLDRFLQAYAVCKASQEARRRGHSVTEQRLPDGSVKLTVQVQEDAA